MTCVDETMFERAQAAEQSFGLAVGGGVVAMSAMGLACTRSGDEQPSPIWSGVDHEADWR